VSHERGGARYEHRKDRIDPGPPAGRAPLSGERTSAILAVDPAAGLVRRVGQLPRPLSDAAVAAVVNRVIVVGGDTPAGVQSSMLALTAQGVHGS
jgi:N-acetylneuraminic acid mutarotase